MMKTQTARVVAVCIGCLLAGINAGARPDYYTSGFYTRGVEEAFYKDQGGIIDPFYVPMKKWALIPRVTLEASGSDNYFLDAENQRDESTLRLMPGALLVFGRPEHNHLFTDFSTIIPLTQSSSQVEDEPSYAVVVGGAYKTGKSQVYGRLGHRRFEAEDTLLGSRVIKKDYIGDLGVEHRISTKSSLGLNGLVELHDYGNDAYVNYNRYYGAGRYYYRVTPKMDTFLQLGVGLDKLEREEPGVTSDATTMDVSVGLRGKPSPKTAASGRIGYAQRTYADSSISDRGHWIANIGGEVTPFGESKFSAELLANIRPDVDSGGDSKVDQRLTLGVNRRLFSERIRGDARVLFGRVDTRTPDGSIEDDYWGFILGVDWWMRRNVSVGAGYSYLDMRSEQSDSFETGQWRLRISWNF